ncbi:MAG: ATP-binding cassette domain-containing protein, partial [Patescibacteria group bacterium]
MIISVKNLKKSYEYSEKGAGVMNAMRNLFNREKLYVEAVKGISFEIDEGEFVGFIGKNGAGKTTTLKMLSGILTPASGEVRVLGHIPFHREAKLQKQFALVMGQKNQLWWDLPAIESFILNKAIYEIPEKEFQENLEEMSELLDIKDILNIQVRQLSLGERMKCELVAALLHSPKILFLDEPTIGLDVVSQK